MDSEIRHWRVGVPGADGHTITGPDWTDALGRIGAVEDVAATTNPFLDVDTQYLSPVTHGFGERATQVYSMPASWIVWVPIFVRASFTTDTMAIWVDSPQAGGTLTLALYHENRTLRQSFGAVSGATYGAKFATIGTPQAITPGTLWLAVMSNAVANIGVTGALPALGMFHNPTTLGKRGAYVRGGVASLPATIEPLDAVEPVPVVCLKVIP